MAFASGIAVVVAISMGGVNAIVGTAISASLLPPIVNCGICLAMSLKIRMANERVKDSADYAVYGAVSFALFAVNFIVIVITGFMTFRYVKNVRPVERNHTYSVDSTSSTNSAPVMNDIHHKTTIAMVDRSSMAHRDNSASLSYIEANKEGSISENSDHIKL